MFKVMEWEAPCCLQENVTDLLCPESGKLQLREDLKNGVYVEGLTEEVVTSGESMLPSFFQANSLCRASARSDAHRPDAQTLTQTYKARRLQLAVLGQRQDSADL